MQLKQVFCLHSNFICSEFRFRNFCFEFSFSFCSQHAFAHTLAHFSLSISFFISPPSLSFTNPHPPHLPLSCALYGNLHSVVWLYCLRSHGNHNNNDQTCSQYQMPNKKRWKKNWKTNFLCKKKNLLLFCLLHCFVWWSVLSGQHAQTKPINKFFFSCKQWKGDEWRMLFFLFSGVLEYLTKYLS